MQKVMNSTICRSINHSPFELLFGVRMGVGDDIEMARLVDDEFGEEFDEQRRALRSNAKKQIMKVYKKKTNCNTIESENQHTRIANATLSQSNGRNLGPV